MFVYLFIDRLNYRNSKSMFQQQETIHRPGSPTNRLQSYFATTSFLNQQQEIAIFIKDFPQIKLSQIPSINTLISLLIKQNSLLAQKCQQQISLLRESYTKHQTLLKSIREVKTENIRLAKDNQLKAKLQVELAHVKEELQKQKQIQFRSMEQQHNKKVNDLHQHEQKIQLYSKTVEHFGGILHFVANQEFKKGQSFIRNLDSFKQLKISEEFSFKKSQLEASLKDMRRKFKYMRNLSQAINQFCARLKQVIQIVPPTILINELTHQVNGFQQLLAEIAPQEALKSRLNSNANLGSSNRKSPGKLAGRNNGELKSPKMKPSGSTSKLNSNDNTFEALKNKGFFEHLLNKAIEASQASQTKEEICTELETLKETLANSKHYYENFLNSLRNSYESQKTAREDQMHVKEQTISFYATELQIVKKKLEQANKQNTDLVAEFKSQANQLQQASEQMEKMEKAMAKIQAQLEQQENLRQKTKVQMAKMNQTQIQQRDSLLQELKTLRKREKQEASEELETLKRKYKDADNRIEFLEKEIRGLNKQIQNLDDRWKAKDNQMENLQTKFTYQSKTLENMTHESHRKNKQIESQKETIRENQHEKSLQISYIQELQNIVKGQQSKIGQLEGKKSNERTAKKQLESLKNSFQAQKKHSTNLEDLACQMKQENQRLKSVIHEMKRELEQVYVRLNNLRQIEEDRERLMFEAQNSQRARQEILREYEEIKFNVMQVEAENKALSLEVRHYKNALTRIEGLSNVVQPV